MNSLDYLLLKITDALDAINDTTMALNDRIVKLEKAVSIIIKEQREK